jgi:uncharacterized protein with NAD-binding domain and iron-sulfur cluster
MPADGPIRIAVLGGGCGAMAAAFELTATPALRARHDVTVYQLGWRLGGKGASGRNMARAARIEEHGLHMWMGFYENAFRAMQACYGEWLAPKPAGFPWKHWTDAFHAQRRITLQEPLPDGTWETWNVDCPRLPRTPGDGHHFSVVALLVALLEWLLERLAGSPHPAHRAAAHHVQRAHAHASGLHPEPGRQRPEQHERVRAALRDARAAMAEVPPTPPVAGEDHGWRRLRLLVDLGLALGKGIAEDVLRHGPTGFDRLNDVEFRAWLREHGAADVTTWSAPIRALYDLGFAYARGDSSSPDNAQVAAGIALRILLLIMFGTKDAPLWKMQAGMGDTVFSPFYEVLRGRGVKFEFFHRVERLEPSATGTLVQRIHLARQVRVRRPTYEPLVEVPKVPGVPGLPCWPSEPRWEQIENGAAIAERLRRDGVTLESPGYRLPDEEPLLLELGTHYDLVVLGISLGALSQVCGDLAAVNPVWGDMVANVPTVGTQAFQVWLTASLEDLGWPAGDTVQTAYAEPFDSWGVMSHLIDREDWPPQGAPRSIHYFCGAMRDEDAGQVNPAAIAWLNAHAGHLWPRAIDRDTGRFDWRLLAGAHSSGDAPFDSQYWRANWEGSERYVLSTPGSIRFRLPPEASGFRNLFLAGDWTRTTLSAGCVESAMEAGMRASRAICGSPAAIARDEPI